jgi:hypothetical protein
VGGDDVQDIAELRRDAPAELRTLRRAVTGEDYGTLAKQVGTVARTIALPLAHPDHLNVEVPGSVTVVVVPDDDEPAPRPSPELLEEVCRHLDTKRTISTELHVVGPRYHRIRVVARVEAEPYASFDTVMLSVAGAINATLDPLGRPAPPLPGEEAPQDEVRGPGREFGRDFPPTALFGVILDVEGELLHGADDHEIAVVPRRERTNGSAG